MKDNTKHRLILARKAAGGKGSKRRSALFSTVHTRSTEIRGGNKQHATVTHTYIVQPQQKGN